jgi:poly(3-hydroxybutyrate) depolymerase
MLGKTMLAGWKDMHPGQQFMGKYIDLFAHIEDKSYIQRTEHFERWYENPIDLPGVYYLQAIKLLFKENQFAKGKFVGLGRKLDLQHIKVPTYLLAGDSDDITTKEQVFNAAALIGAPSSAVVKKLAPGGHIGLFMGRRTLAEIWPDIGRWIRAQSRQ